LAGVQFLEEIFEGLAKTWMFQQCQMTLMDQFLEEMNITTSRIPRFGSHETSLVHVWGGFERYESFFFRHVISQMQELAWVQFLQEILEGLTKRWMTFNYAR
jgi:hypothetical protein